MTRYVSWHWGRIRTIPWWAALMVVLAWAGVALMVRSAPITALRSAFSSPAVNFKIDVAG
jgi:hypothetical protein